MSLENTGDKERKNQIETLKSREEVLFLKQRKKKILLLKQIRKEIINDGSINKQVSLSRLKELMRQSNTLSETEFQNRLSKVIEKKPTIYILYER